MTTALLLGILAKATVVLGLALAGTRVARTSRASVRHLMLAGAFGALIGLPIASVIAPAVRIPVSVPMSSADTPVDVGAQIVDAFVDVSPVAGPVVGPTAASSNWPSIATVVIAIWLGGIGICLAPVAAGLWQLRVLRRSALPWLGCRATIGRLAGEAQLHRPVNILIHESVCGPMTFGVRQPIVVLPVDSQEWPEEELRRALIHEFEHVRRSDWVGHTLVRVITACYWFHPIVWVAWRQLSLEAERACDDAVLASASAGRGHEATAYADQLVGLAQRLSASTRHPHLAMANRHDLTTRVMAVLDAGQPRGRAGVSSVAAAAAVTVVLAGALSAIRIVAAPSLQTPAPTAPAGRPKFDAATIKPCQAEENPTGARGTAGGTNATFSPGRFFVPCVTTEQLIYLAYASYGARDDEHLANDDLGTASNATKIRGGPSWVHSLKDKYSIEATAAGATERTVLMGAMVQSLLEDRFKLKIHREIEEAPMFELIVAKGGLKLKPMKDGDCDPSDDSPPPLSVPTAAVPRCGNVNMTMSNTGLTRWTYGGFALSSLASMLSSALKVHVIDKTGITDKFVFRFEFLREQPTGAAASAETMPTGPDIFTALPDELGLKLERTKGPRGFLVIDQIERPASASDEAAAGRPGSSQPPARAQGAGQSASLQTAPRFPVASIKPCDAVPVVPGGRSGGGGRLDSSPGTITVTCMTVSEMVRRAYVQYGNPPPPYATGVPDADEIKGGPAWVRSDKYSIEAKAEGAPPSLTTMAGPMLRALLEDRFQLKIHEDLKDVPALALTVATGGLKIKPADPASCTPPDPEHPGGPRIMGADGLVRTAANEKPLCTAGVGRHGANLTYTVTGQTFERVARTLSGFVFTRPVLDKTGLIDQFSFSVEFAPDETMRPVPAPVGETPGTPDGPSLASVLEKRLGLKLVPARAQQGVLVIDSVQRPAPDLAAAPALNRR